MAVRANQVSIVGAGGHIGLPLSVVVAEAGYDVFGIDKNTELNAQLNAGVVPYVEHGAQELLDRGLGRGNLRFTNDNTTLATSATIVVIVGTPIDDNLNPRIDPLIDLLGAHAPHIPDGQLIVLRSTVSPGTTELLRTVLERGSGRTEGVDFHLVFAPERVLQTRAVEEIQNLPQLVGAFTESSFVRAEEFFGRFIAMRCISMKPVEAELGKLITNMSRYVSFAMANEFYMICNTYGANSHAVIAACNEEYPRLNLPIPGPNVGGPCLYKDGYYLTEHISYPEIIANAFRVNESMPRYLLDRVTAIAKPQRVGILGLAFKANCDDTRNSLSYKLIKQVRGINAESVAVDPYVPDASDPTRLRGVDVLILMTPHREFKDLDALLAFVDNPDCIVVDAWNFWPATKAASPDGIYRAGNVMALAAAH